MPCLTFRIAVVAAAFVFTGCDHNAVEPQLTQLPRALTATESQLVDADNAFAFRLLGAALRGDSAAGNVFLSPLSASMALGMALNGAAGATADSMRTALGYSSLSLADIDAGYRSLIALLSGLDASVTWDLANSVWYRQDYVFRQSFLDTTRVYFSAAVTPLDFTAANAGAAINRWVSDRTQGRIQTIVPDALPSDAIMYLVNAIYFKGAWTTRFDPARTQPGSFAAPSGPVSVPMMHADDVPVRLGASGNGVLMVDLPYARGAYAMTIVLPPVGASVDSLAQGLTQQQWDAWTGALGDVSTSVEMPKFTVRYGTALDDALRALGMGIAFCDSMQFDFTGLDPSGRACLTGVRHEAFVQVDEAGTEASAATSVGVGVTVAPQTILIDRPFLFAIRERLSGTILFLGVIRDPSS